MSTTTTNFGFTKPGVNDPIDANQWGTQLNADLDTLDSLLKKPSVTGIGTTRPTYAAAGTIWVNNTTNPWILYMYDGTDDIQIGTIDTTTNTFTPSGSSNVNFLSLSANQPFLFNATTPVPSLTFNMKAGKKYIIQMAGFLTPPGTGWGTAAGNINVFPKWATTNTFSYISGFSFVNSGTAVATNSVGLFIGSTGTISFSVNASSSTGMTVRGSIYAICQVDTDQTFSTVLTWTATQGTVSGTANLIAGSYITYQQIT